MKEAPDFLTPWDFCAINLSKIDLREAIKWGK
jgi:hypothetical protein